MESTTGLKSNKEDTCMKKPKHTELPDRVLTYLSLDQTCHEKLYAIRYRDVEIHLLLHCM